LKAVAPGDVVTVTRIDRLARSTFDLFAIVKRIVDAGAQFRSLAEPWADTSTSTGRLMIAVLGGLADVERDLIRTRTAEGRTRAKARGQRMGRPPKLTPEQQREPPNFPQAVAERATKRHADGPAELHAHEVLTDDGAIGFGETLEPIPHHLRTGGGPIKNDSYFAWRKFHTASFIVHVP
jgi:DNA invertase Pin-like site-specific DNA recombinase